MSEREGERERDRERDPDMSRGQNHLVSLHLQPSPSGENSGKEQTDTPRTAGVRSRTWEATWTLSRPPSPVERERESKPSRGQHKARLLYIHVPARIDKKSDRLLGGNSLIV